MKISCGSIVVDLSGKLGGQFAQRTGAGLQLSTITKPGTRKSRYSSRRTETLATLTPLWRKLTNSQRLAYEQSAEAWQSNRVVKNSTRFTGFQLFILINWRAFLAGFSVRTQPKLPQISTHITAASANLAFSSNNARFNVFKNNSEVVATFILMSRPYPPHAKIPASACRLVTVVNLGSLATLNVTIAYVSKFGNVSPGRRIRTRMYIVSRTTFYRGEIIELSSLTT